MWLTHAHPHTRCIHAFRVAARTDNFLRRDGTASIYDAAFPLTL